MAMVRLGWRDSADRVERTPDHTGSGPSPDQDSPLFHATGAGIEMESEPRDRSLFRGIGLVSAREASVVTRKSWRRTFALGTLAAAAVWGSPFASAVAAAVPDNSAALSIGASQTGNYLAGLIASADRDTGAAEMYYREVLTARPAKPGSDRARILGVARKRRCSGRERPCGSPVDARSPQSTRAPHPLGQPHEARRLRRFAHAASGQGSAVGRRDGGAADGMELCRTRRLSSRHRDARSNS